MSDIHIDDFYKDVGKIFLRLYSTFPRKSILYVEDISGPDQPDDFGLHSDRFLASFSAMVWLGDHDYLKYDAPIKQEALDQVALTEKSFLLLSSRSALDFSEPQKEQENDIASVPNSILDHDRTNINQLRKAFKSGSSIMIKQAVEYILNSAFDRN